MKMPQLMEEQGLPLVDNSKIGFLQSHLGFYTIKYHDKSVQFSPQSGPTLYNPMDCSTPGFPVHHQLPELVQTHVNRVGDAIRDICKEL